MDDILLGERIRLLRTEQGKTLAELGEELSLSTSYLSQIEHNRTTPSLSTVMSIAKVLGVEPRYFFESADDVIYVTRAGEARPTEGLNPGVRREPLSPAVSSSVLKVDRVVIQPNSPPQEFKPYHGEEMCFVLAGEVTVSVGSEIYQLKEGDSIHYDAMFDYLVYNHGDRPCELLWCRASY